MPVVQSQRFQTGVESSFIGLLAQEHITPAGILNRSLERLKAVLAECYDWREILTSLREKTNPHLKRNFVIVNENNESIPATIGKYSEVVVQHGSNIQPKSLESNQHRIVKNLCFGYAARKGRLRLPLGEISYAVLDKENNVIEMGFPTKGFGKRFFDHLRGVNPSEKHLKRICEINKKIFSYLKADQKCEERLGRFALARKWGESTNQIPNTKKW